MNDQDIRDRIEGRKWAEETIAEAARQSPAFQDAFRAALLRTFKVQDLDPKAMDDDEARAFGRKVIGFGMHAGKTYDETPFDYLVWLTDENLQTVRYIRSRRVQAEQNGDDDQ